MSRDVEDGMGFSGLVPTCSEREYEKSEAARTKRMIEIVNERDAALKRLAAAEKRIKWQGEMLERAKPSVLAAWKRLANRAPKVNLSDKQRGELRESGQWLSDYEKGPVE